jgi:inositol phosphorylceramide mannosyltransferase catalytic subunit
MSTEISMLLPGRPTNTGGSGDDPNDVPHTGNVRPGHRPNHRDTCPLARPRPDAQPLWSILVYYHKWFSQAKEVASLTRRVPLSNISVHVHEAHPGPIPKIIHQTYINDSIPPHWRAAQQSCKAAHPDYEYIFWSDQQCVDFISHEYPWFLETFLSYPFPIQRADAVRYFILFKYGGNYIDLDEGCIHRLDSLGKYNLWVREAWPAGISNNILGSSPMHPFFSRVIESLNDANHDWRLPYPTVMFTTGPVFLTSVWVRWLKEVSGRLGATGITGTNIRVLTFNEYNGDDESFFRTYQGSSWHQWDAAIWSWSLRNWSMILLALGLVAVSFFLNRCRLTWRSWFVEK